MSDSLHLARARLGLSRGASLDEARAAFRRLAKRCHPDAPGGNAQAFQALHTAFRTIANDPATVRAERRRALVSRFWKAARKAPASPERERGADMAAVLSLSLKDMVHGAVRRVSLPDGRALDVHCPAGCAPGTVIRLRGAGAPGRHGGEPGDVRVRITLLAHERNVLKGRDLHVQHWLALNRLRNGGTALVRTPRGLLKVRIPPLSHHGRVLRLAGQGLPACGTRPAGHLFITLKARRGESLGDALGRFTRLWANPLRPVA